MFRLEDMVEPFDVAYTDNKPYVIPDIRRAEKTFLRKVSVMERALRKAKVPFRWDDRLRCFYTWKDAGTDYNYIMYIRVNARDYSFGSENWDDFYDTRARSVANAAKEWRAI